MKRAALLLTVLVIFAHAAPAQRVDSSLNSHVRIWVIDRVTDAQGRRMPAHAEGKLGFVAIYNADRTLCVVEYVAEKYEDFDSLRADTDPRVKVFEKAKTRREVFERAVGAAGFVNFNLDRFVVRVP